jgi:choline-sulfatase
MKHMSRRNFSKKIGMGLGALALNSSKTLKALADDDTNRPNILFICSDQHSYKYAGYAGHPHVKTPSLDRLAESGAAFTNVYSGNPVCVPGRSCLMTGMYASDCGSYCNTTVWDGSYPIWGSYFQQDGYYTRAYGKMDLDDTKDIGFDEIKTKHAHKYNPDITSLFRNPLCYRMKERPGVNGDTRPNYHRNDSEITTEAVDFLKNESKSKSKPWALYLGYLQPHPPFTAKEEFYNIYNGIDIDLPDVTPDELENMHLVYQQLRHFKRIATPIDKERIRKARIAYYGMITELDMLIGKVLAALQESGQAENTYIIYTSDHGESLGDNGLWYKNNLFESAVHVPLIISGPGIEKNKRVETPVSQIDLVPTLLDAAQIDRIDYLRGRSLAPLMNGKSRNGDEVVYSESHSEGNCTGSFMIRKGDWKYIYFTGYDDLLYNLKDDPGEVNNRINDFQCQDIVSDLQNELFNRVDPDQITFNAFRKQKEIRDKYTNKLSKKELINMFQSRLGTGQSNIIATQLKTDLY